MVVAVPRPPHRSHSLGSNSSLASSTLGGVINKHISVERLRHSISVARGHPPTGSVGSSGSGNISSGGSRGDPVHDSKSICGGVSKNLSLRRHSSSGHSSSGGDGGGGSGGGGGGGWTGTNQPPSSKFSVTPAGFSNDGGKRVRGDGIGARQRGMRPAQQVF